MTFEQTIINHIAPTLCGIKPATMFTLRKDFFIEKEAYLWKEKAKEHKVELNFFPTSETLVMFFSYNKSEISKILNKQNVKEYLKEKNYPIHKNITENINELFTRLQTSTTFPHEVGIFLGYPLEDVILFEKNRGKNCKCCGYWKSYTNNDDTKKSLIKFHYCSNICKQWLDEGFSVTQIIKKYKLLTNVA